MGSQFSALALPSSANAPSRCRLITRSPTRSRVTSGPIATTSPAASLPGTKGGCGRNWYLPASIKTSTYCAPRARILTCTSPAPGGGGAGISRSASTSGPPNASQTTAFIAPVLFRRFGSDRCLVRRPKLFHDLPIRVTGKAVLVEEQDGAGADEQIGRIFECGGRVVQNTRRLIDIVASIQDAVADLQLARNDVGVRAGEVLVRRCRVALFPMMQRRPGAGLAADPQHLDSGHRRLLDPRRLGPHERILNVLKHRSDILRKRHASFPPLDWDNAQHDRASRHSPQGMHNPLGAEVVGLARKTQITDANRRSEPDGSEACTSKREVGHDVQGPGRPAADLDPPRPHGPD